MKLKNSFALLNSDANNDTDDDEEQMLAALKQVAHHVRRGPKPHQNQSTKMPKALTKRQIDWIVAQVNAGKLELPQLDQIDDDSFKMVWALVDSGSAAHVADVRKEFPGAEIRPSEAQRKGVQYQGAGGQLMPNQGEACIPYLTPDGQHRFTVFQNAAVGMPILSTSKIAEEDNLLMFHKRGGYIFHIPPNTCTPCIKILGGYFVKLRVPKELNELTTDLGRPDA